MPGNWYIHEYDHLRILEKLTNPYYLETQIVDHYLSEDLLHIRSLDEDTDNYNKRIFEYFSYPEFNWRGKKPNDPQELAKPYDNHTNFREIALKASGYFQQGLEMYKTSLIMDINSSPLIEYYSFLQCVKGSAIIELDLNEDLLFSFHGISSDFNSGRYPKAVIKAYGVFHVIFLLGDPYNEMIDFFNRKIDLNLSSLIKKIPSSPASSFIVSYLLSTLVRYQPDKWQSICRGLDDDIFFRYT
ncbi:MAG: hypothetical protein ACFFAU_18500 [Candidatus Hodarchaeota archaeon]